MEQSSYLFAGDSYDTPPDAPKSVWYRLLLKNRWYFYVNNFSIFCRTGRCGRRGELTKERQIPTPMKTSGWWSAAAAKCTCAASTICGRSTAVRLC